MTSLHRGSLPSKRIYFVFANADRNISSQTLLFQFKRLYCIKFRLILRIKESNPYFCNLSVYIIKVQILIKILECLRYKF